MMNAYALLRQYTEEREVCDLRSATATARVIVQYPREVSAYLTTYQQEAAHHQATASALTRQAEKALAQHIDDCTIDNLMSDASRATEQAAICNEVVGLIKGRLPWFA